VQRAAAAEVGLFSAREAQVAICAAGSAEEEERVAAGGGPEAERETGAREAVGGKASVVVDGEGLEAYAHIRTRRDVHKKKHNRERRRTQQSRAAVGCHGNGYCAARSRSHSRRRHSQSHSMRDGITPPPRLRAGMVGARARAPYTGLAAEVPARSTDPRHTRLDRRTARRRQRRARTGTRARVHRNHKAPLAARFGAP
jgi:hypothetical protein